MAKKIAGRMVRPAGSDSPDCRVLDYVVDKLVERVLSAVVEREGDACTVDAIFIMDDCDKLATSEILAGIASGEGVLEVRFHAYLVVIFHVIHAGFSPFQHVAGGHQEISEYRGRHSHVTLDA